MADSRQGAGLVKIILGPLFIIGLILVAWIWISWRVSVPAGQTLVVKRMLGTALPADQANTYRVIPSKLAGTKGIQEQVYGEGYHWVNPILNDTEISDKGYLKLIPASGRRVTPKKKKSGWGRRRSSRPKPKVQRPPRGPQLEQVPIAVVTSQTGEDLPSGQFLTDKAGFKGTLMRVLTPGAWRFNPHAYVVEKAWATVVPPGYVGVVTNRTGSKPRPGELATEKEKGVLAKILQPGIYYLNPVARTVDIVEIGYRQLTLSKIAFKSWDGFDIYCDISVVWGIHPKNAPMIVKKIGRTNADIIDKVIKQVVNAASRNQGAKFRAAELVAGGGKRYTFELGATGVTMTISEGEQSKRMVRVFLTKPDGVIEIQDTVGGELTRHSFPSLVSFTKALPPLAILYAKGRLKGDALKLVSGKPVTLKSRQDFIKIFTQTLKKECEQRKIDILIGLIRDITIPEKFRKPIQQAQIERESLAMVAEQSRTQEIQNALVKQEGEVKRVVTVTKAETKKLVAELRERGKKKVAEIQAEGRAAVAEIMAQVAEKEAAIARIAGEGAAKVIAMEKKAEADRFTQVVKAFGTPEAYTRYMFAQGLPPNFTIILRYAGEGTFWTDMPKEFKSLERAASMKILQGKKK